MAEDIKIKVEADTKQAEESTKKVSDEVNKLSQAQKNAMSAEEALNKIDAERAKILDEVNKFEKLHLSNMKTMQEIVREASISTEQLATAETELTETTKQEVKAVKEQIDHTQQIRDIITDYFNGLQKGIITSKQFNDNITELSTIFQKHKQYIDDIVSSLKKQEEAQQQVSDTTETGITLLGKIGIVATIAIAAYKEMGKAIKFLKESIDIASEATRINNQLVNSLNTLGKASHETQVRLSNEAEELSQLYKINKTYIESLQSRILLTTKDINATYETTKAALNLQAAFEAVDNKATGMGTSIRNVESAIGFLDRALAGDINFLNKFGLTFSEAAQQGNDFKLKVQEINEQLGEAGLANVKNFAGTTDELSSVWREFKERVGEGIISLLETTGIINKTIQTIKAGLEITDTTFFDQARVALINSIPSLKEYQNEIGGLGKNSEINKLIDTIIGLDSILKGVSDKQEEQSIEEILRIKQRGEAYTALYKWILENSAKLEKAKQDNIIKTQKIESDALAESAIDNIKNDEIRKAIVKDLEKDNEEAIKRFEKQEKFEVEMNENAIAEHQKAIDAKKDADEKYQADYSELSIDILNEEKKANKEALAEEIKTFKEAAEQKKQIIKDIERIEIEVSQSIKEETRNRLSEELRLKKEQLRVLNELIKIGDEERKNALKDNSSLDARVRARDIEADIAQQVETIQERLTNGTQLQGEELLNIIKQYQEIKSITEGTPIRVSLESDIADIGIALSNIPKPTIQDKIQLEIDIKKLENDYQEAGKIAKNVFQKEINKEPIIIDNLIFDFSTIRPKIKKELQSIFEEESVNIKNVLSGN